MSSLYAIFDIDGVIVDSEQLHFDVLKTLLPEQTKGVTPQDLIGLSLKETLLSLVSMLSNMNKLLSRSSVLIKISLCHVIYVQVSVRLFKD